MKQKARASVTASMKRSGPGVAARAQAHPPKDDVNWLNIGLMAGSCGAAIAAPFQVFLFAYTVLGPLHYLTEISWLHDRNYFTKRQQARRWWLALVYFTILVIAFAYLANDPMQRTVSPLFQIGLIYLVFASAAAALYVRDWLNAVGLLTILALGLAFFRGFATYALAANLLVTIVHVFIFTGAFILYGAIKSKSRVAVLSLLVFVVCAMAAATVAAPFRAPGERVRQLYAGFEYLNRALLQLSGRPPQVYEAMGIGVMRLIAFAYLYHYLNWFSKTSIIKWHEVTRLRAAAILGCWAAGLGIYLLNYRLGFGIFYIMSMLHVFLEFPLNHQTLLDIGRSLRGGRWWALGSEHAG